MNLISHGGDIYSYAKRYGGRDVMDFSANINPLGMPEGVQRAAAEAVALCRHYPDPLCRDLRRALMETEQIPDTWFYCGNGASDVLYRLARAIEPGLALLTAPTFSEYESALLLAGWEVRHHALSRQEGFHVTERILDEIQHVSAVYLCNPNNPTGIVIEPEIMEEILAGCKKVNAYLIVDECFLDFTDNPEAYTLKEKLSAYPGLILLRAFTKMYAMPGVRLGYCMCADTELIRRLYQAGQPWNVSVIAQHCGIAALRETEFVEETRRYVREQKDYLHGALQDLGFVVYDGSANYLCFNNTLVTELQTKLEKRGFLLRSCLNYRGLDESYFRIAVKTEAENRSLLQVLMEIREEEG